MSDDYLWDRSGTPDEEIQRLEGLLVRYRYRRPAERVALLRRPRLLVPLAMAAAFILAIGLWNASDRAPVASWELKPLVGAPQVNAERVMSGTAVDIGNSIATDEVSRAEIFLADVGVVELESNTRVNIVDAGRAGRRLVLAHGTLHVMLAESGSGFVIETPTARAVDLGSDYYLTVDSDGAARLCVISGSVALETDDHRSIVPAGAVCESKPDAGLGTPHCENVPDEFSDALKQFDFGKVSSAALSTVLAEAGPCDLIPLWHMLRRVDASERGRIYDRMASFATPPVEVTRDGILTLDQAMMQLWWTDIKSHQTCLLCHDDRQETSS